LENRYKDVTLYSGLGGHMSRQAMNFIFVEEERARKTLCIEKKTCGCVQRTSYGLPCACFIAMKIRHNKLIRLDEIHHIDISCIWVKKKVMKICFRSRRSDVVSRNVSKEFRSK